MNDIRTADRWLGAVCYLSVFVLVPILMQKEKSPFLSRHCRLGFALLIVQIVALMLISAIDATIGRIPVLGLIISVLLQLGASLAILAFSLIGFFKALAGEEWQPGGLDDLAERIPIN